ncbi:TIGR04024 family LLM class F420-dependent oxidoreductase [Halegenticoccus tardaugens]|uniref:TIGR04024 family LLM class F420-dependent oxidoreductase n=1 Tax=Halegenticoccus tardaugens TaxID=2071624 RepID=UPI00100A787F|nr:TIGR04024 family LLM class F420-dependent oxidoreductase [Halegenticoccus tardaugens]
MTGSVEFDVNLPVTARPTVDQLAEVARRAEALGYERTWLPETWGRNAVATLAVLAERTETIGIGASILNVYSRSPALVGQTAATLQEVSDGRFRLGLGPSGPAVVENWHGVPFDRPLRRTREYVEITRRVLSGEPVEYDGDLFDLSGFRLRGDAPDEPPRIDATGMGPKAVELAGRFADGWHALMLTPDGLRERLGDLERGAELGGRRPEDVRTMLTVTACAREDGDRARELLRQHLAFYLGGMGTFYRDALARQGYDKRATGIHDAWQSGDRRRAMDLIDDDLLRRLGVGGTPAEVREGIETFAGIDGVDAVAVSFPREIDADDALETLDALDPLVG